jgi:hypothetical protein
MGDAHWMRSLSRASLDAKSCSPLGVLASPLWGGAGSGGRRCEATFTHDRTTPTPPAFATLRRATLPTRGRVGPSSLLAPIPVHLKMRYRCPYSRSISASRGSTQVSRPCLHWPKSRVVSISHSSAFIPLALIATVCASYYGKARAKVFSQDERWEEMVTRHRFACAACSPASDSLTCAETLELV